MTATGSPGADALSELRAELCELESHLEANDVDANRSAWGADVIRRTLEALAGQASGADALTPQLDGCDGGVAVRWCPRCGACTCPENQGDVEWIVEPGCPIHADSSKHGQIHTCAKCGPECSC